MGTPRPADVLARPRSSDRGGRASSACVQPSLPVLLVVALLGVASGGCPEPAPVDEAPAGCPDGFVDDRGTCVPAHCGPGPWGWLDPAIPGPVIHVAPEGRADGDGSREDPLDSVQDGFDAARAAGAPLVALAAGRWEESLDLEGDDAPIEVRGRCAEMVEIRGDDGLPAVWAIGWSLALSGLTISGGGPGVQVETGLGQPTSELALRDVRITDVALAGMLVLDDGSSVVLERVDVVGIRPREDGNFGSGLDAEFGPTVHATDFRIESTAGLGIFLSDEGTMLSGERISVRDAGGLGAQIQSAARVEADDFTVAGTRVGIGQFRGQGINVTGGGTLVATRLLLEDNLVTGLGASGEGTRVEVYDSTIRWTRIPEQIPSGSGIGVVDGAVLEATNVLLEENELAGLLASGDGAQATLLGVRVERTGEGTSGHSAAGLAVYQGATLLASDVVVAGTTGTGLVASGGGTAVDLAGVDVLDTLASDVGTDGHGVHVQDGASLVAASLLVEDSTGFGVGAMHEGTLIDIADSEVRGTRLTPGGHSGTGIGASAGARLLAARVVSADNRLAGWLFSGPGVTAELVDCEATGTLPAADPGTGAGIIVQSAASVLATRPGVEGNAAPGAIVQAGGFLSLVDADVVANGFAGAVALDGGHLSLEGGRVRGTVPSADFGGGLGVYSWDEEAPSTVDLSGVSFEDLAGPGVYVIGEGGYRVSGCTFEDSGSGGLPGGVFAAGGVRRWTDAGEGIPASGLLVDASSFESLGGDGVLLDESTATLSSNEFLDLAGLDLYVQRCESVPPPLVDGQEPAEPWCQPYARDTQPRMEYRLYLSETGIEE